MVNNIEYRPLIVLKWYLKSVQCASIIMFFFNQTKQFILNVIIMIILKVMSKLLKNFYKNLALLNLSFFIE